MDELQFRVRLDDEESLAAALEAAEARGDVTAEVVSTERHGMGSQIEPVSAMLIGAGIIAAGKFIVDWWDKVRGGLVIDQRREADDLIYRDKDVPYGWLLAFPADGGAVKVEVKDAPKDAVERWISEVISGAFGTFGQLAEAAKSAVGDDKVEATPGTR